LARIKLFQPSHASKKCRKIGVFSAPAGSEAASSPSMVLNLSNEKPERHGAMNRHHQPLQRFEIFTLQPFSFLTGC
jgi:hypothetical protein